MSSLIPPQVFHSPQRGAEVELTYLCTGQRKCCALIEKNMSQILHGVRKYSTQSAQVKRGVQK